MTTEMATSLLDMVTTTMSSATDGSGSPTMDTTKPLSGKSLDEELHFVMSAVVGPIFCFIGMVGNLLSIVVWSRPKMRSSTGRYLSGQAVADFGVLLFFILADSAQHWNPDIVYSVSYGVFFSYIGYPGFFFAIVCSIWFTVGVTADRYLMVCWITKAKRYCSEQRANFGLILITINCFLVNIPHYFSYKPVFPDDNDNSRVSSDAMATNSTNNGTHVLVPTTTPSPAMRVKTFAATDFTTGSSGQFYEFWIHCIILILVPWTTVCMMNVMIIRTVRESNKKNADKKTRQSAKNSRDSENQITRLLLVVTFTFLFFIGLQCVIQCVYMQKPPGANWFLVNSSFAFAKTGIVFNSSLNFFLYCLTGRRFRKELLKMLGLDKKGDRSTFSTLSDRPTGSSSHTTSSIKTSTTTTASDI